MARENLKLFEELLGVSTFSISDRISDFGSSDKVYRLRPTTFGGTVWKYNISYVSDCRSAARKRLQKKNTT